MEKLLDEEPVNVGPVKIKLNGGLLDGKTLGIPEESTAQEYIHRTQQNTFLHYNIADGNFIGFSENGVMS